MKKTVLFLLVALVLIFAQKALSQNSGNTFFIPQGEMQQRYEKLPPIATPQPKMPSARAAYEQRRRQQLQNANQSRAVAQPTIRRKIKQYIAVDGRFIPVYDENVPAEPAADVQIAADTAQQSATTEIPTSPNTVAATPAPINLPMANELPPVNQSMPSSISEPSDVAQTPIQDITIVQPPTVETDPNLPSYRNRYGQYIADLQIFHQTGQMPYNAELEQTLDKLSSNRQTVLFKGIVE